MVQENHVLHVVPLHEVGDGVVFNPRPGAPVGVGAVVDPVDMLIVVNKPGDEGVAVGILYHQHGGAVGEGLIVGIAPGPISRDKAQIVGAAAAVGHVVYNGPGVFSVALVLVNVHGHFVGAIGKVGHQGIRVVFQLGVVVAVVEEAAQIIRVGVGLKVPGVVTGNALLGAELPVGVPGPRAVQW